MKKYDLIIIGGGAGAFAAAIKANELGLATAMSNYDLPAGGTCVNVGCVPSKVLVHAAHVVHMVRAHGVPGIHTTVEKIDFEKIIQDELATVQTFRDEKYEKVLARLPNVTYKEGGAVFSAQKEITVDGEVLSADNFIIATGSKATVPPIDGIHEVGYLTHIEALALKKLPKEMVCIGGGPVALELAQVYARFGTKVTILQRGTRIFPHGESELIDRLVSVLEKEGITIKTNVLVQRARIENGRKVLTYSTEGHIEEITTDEILLAAGKTPNTKDLRLDISGVTVNERGAVVVSNTFQTTVPFIYAVGDVTSLPKRLETTAGHEGTLAIENIVQGKHNSIDYRTVPYAIFTDPGYASVGVTEDEQMKEAGVCACRTVPFTQIPKAGIIRRTEGLIKMGVDPKTGVIVGVHILAPDAADLIAAAVPLIKNKNTIDDVLAMEPVFPTLSEAIKYAALSFTKDISQLSCCI
ncbi:MAG: mercury(II) reductase [Parcubacteria group bacterium 21-54-25]|nr:MAG: mercury(II) reductase [Parcubacteria group bacterium 21-54-25]HQU07679.1 mercury(II) reductase [Candidatus Paceibacterota bacterium]